MLSVTSPTKNHHYQTCRLPFRPLSTNGGSCVNSFPVRSTSAPVIPTTGTATLIASSAAATVTAAANMAVSNTTTLTRGPASTNPKGFHPVQSPMGVAQALEIARDSPYGTTDPSVSVILEDALTRIWAKITAQPTSYVMTRNEFAVFNFFQDRFIGNELAREAKRRYWDNTTATTGSC